MSGLMCFWSLASHSRADQEGAHQIDDVPEPTLVQLILYMSSGYVDADEIVVACMLQLCCNRICLEIPTALPASFSIPIIVAVASSTESLPSSFYDGRRKADNEMRLWAGVRTNMPYDFESYNNIESYRADRTLASCNSTIKSGHQPTQLGSSLLLTSPSVRDGIGIRTTKTISEIIIAITQGKTSPFQ